MADTYVSARRLLDRDGNPVKRRLKWYPHHNGTGFKVAEAFVFPTRKATQEFIETHLDPENRNWRGRAARMAKVCQAAHEKYWETQT